MKHNWDFPYHRGPLGPDATLAEAEAEAERSNTLAIARQEARAVRASDLAAAIASDQDAWLYGCAAPPHPTPFDGAAWCRVAVLAETRREERRKARDSARTRVR